MIFDTHRHNNRYHGPVEETFNKVFRVVKWVFIVLAVVAVGFFGSISVALLRASGVI